MNLKKNSGQNIFLINLEKPNECKLCNYTSISIVDNNTINDPYIAKCSNSKCRNWNEFPRIPVSIILYVLKLWLIDEKNATEISNHIRETIVECKISKDKIINILMKMRYYIANLIKDIYSWSFFH